MKTEDKVGNRLSIGFLILCIIVSLSLLVLDIYIIWGVIKWNMKKKEDLLKK